MELWENISIIRCMLIKNLRIKRRYGLDSLALFLNPFISLLPFIFLSLTKASHSVFFYQNAGVESASLYYIVSYFTSFFISNTIVMVSMYIAYEIRQGTFETLILCPKRESILVGNHILSSYIIYLLESLVLGFLFVFFLQHGSINVKFEFFLPTVIIGYLASYGVGMILSVLTIKTKMPRTTFMINSLILLTSGASYSVRVLPSWIQILSFINPLTYAIDLMRYSIIGSKTYFDAKLELGLFTLVSIFWFMIGKIVFERVIKILKEHGSLTNY